MREHNDTPAESPSARYDALLQSSLHFHEEFNAEGARVAALYSGGSEREAEERSAARHGMEATIDSLARERVALLRGIEKPRTIEDAYERVRVMTDEQTQDAAAASVRAAFAADGDAAESGSAGESVTGPSDALTKAEAAEFLGRCEELARANGYEAERDQGWLVLKRGPLEIEMYELPFPASAGIGGRSRILQLAIYDRSGAGRRLLHFDGAWDQACTDVNVQKEVDRLVAIFG